MLSLHSLSSALFLSIDSFVLSVALGPLIRSPIQRRRLALLFGGCDGLALWAGSALGSSAWSYEITCRAVALLAGASCCLVALRWNGFRVNPPLALAFPVLMSLDNFAYGVDAGASAIGITERAAVSGLASFALSILGLFLFSIIRLPDVRMTERCAGYALVVITVGLLF